MKQFRTFNFQDIVLRCLIISLTFAACQSKDNKNQIVSVDGPEITIFRADSILANANTENSKSLYADLKAIDSTFAFVYANQILRTSESDLSSESAVVERFITERGIAQLLDTTMLLFPDLKREEREFASAFGHYKSIFPNHPIPKVIACNTDMSLAAFTVGDSILAFSTELFLGENFPGYESLYPKYVNRTFTAEHILPKAMTVLVQNIAGNVPENGNLLDQMLYHGKVLLAVKQLLPEMADSLILEYTADQADWVKANEGPIWGYLTKENLLYNSDWRAIQKLVNPSPNSPGMPAEAPGRTANYIGMKIVESYLRKHPNVSLDDLFKNTESQKILQESAYHPSR
ncbi:MAG: hypothetical protein ABIV51_00945 [Saprospiraceae bacterium]